MYYFCPFLIITDIKDNENRNLKIYIKYFLNLKMKSKKSKNF